VIANEHTQSLSFGLPYDVHTHTLLAFAQDQLQRGANDLLLALGYTHHETFGAHSTWNLEYARALPARLRLTLAAGTAFHAPDSTDRYGFGGNPALHPEISRQGQLSLQWQPSGSTQLRASIFENRVDGLIQYVALDPVNFIYQAQNVDRARIRGAEVDYEWRGAAWRLRGGYSAQDPRDLTSGEPLLRRARRNLTLGAQYQAGALNASADLQAAGPRVDFGGVAMAGYSLLNLGLGYRLPRGLELQLRLDNALDRRYELASGYNTPGRSLTLAMRYHIR
jgi:vitamin B12 transporter